MINPGDIELYQTEEGKKLLDPETLAELDAMFADMGGEKGDDE